MEQDKFFLDRKYSKFIKNIKLSLNKAILNGNMQLADNINDYLDTIENLKKVNSLKEKNDIKIYSNEAKMLKKKLEDLQKQILYNQFNNTNSFTDNNLIINIPKFKNKDISYIFMFIYKFLKINSKSICIILKNFIDDLFNLNLINNIEIKHNSNIETVDIESLCNSKILENITVIYDNEINKIKYVYNSETNLSEEFKKNKKVLNKLLEKINNFNLNTFFNIKNTNITNNLVEGNNNIIDDSNNIILKKPIITNKLLDNENIYIFNKKSEKEFKITLAILLINLLKNINCDKNNKLSKKSLKNQICNYLTFNPEYNIEKEYNLLYNYFLTRDLESKNIEKNINESNIHIIIPNFSLSLINNIVILFYIFIKNNKEDICKNILNLLNQIKNELVKKTYSFYDNGNYFYTNNKILSLCSNSSQAQNLINTFYLKYKEYDKVLISNLLLKIIENDSLKIKYDIVEDKFSVIIINQKTLNIDFDKIDKTKLLEGLNNDLKCINESINKDFIIKLIDFIRDSLNRVINIISDIKLITSIFNLSTDSQKIYNYLKNSKTNFKIRKLLVIIFIKFLIVHISKFYSNPNNNEFNMYDSLVNDLYKHICEKLTIEFSYNIYQKMEDIYKEFPNYDIN